MSTPGKALIVAGLVLVALGLLLVFGPKVPLLGKLPGDIRIEGDGWTFYLPLATCVLLSIVLTVILNVVAGLLWRGP